MTELGSAARFGVAAHLPGPVVKAFRSWHCETWQPSPPGFPKAQARPGNPGEEGMRPAPAPALWKEVLLFQPLGLEARILLQCCDCGPVLDASKQSLWSPKGCVEALPTVPTPAAPAQISVRVCPAPFTDRVPSPCDHH